MCAVDDDVEGSCTVPDALRWTLCFLVSNAVWAEVADDVAKAQIATRGPRAHRVGLSLTALSVRTHHLHLPSH